RAKSQGDHEKAMLLADQAIRLLAANDIDTYHWHLWRESLKNLGNRTPDYTGLIEFIREAVTTFQQDRNVLRTIDALRHLVSYLANAGNKQEAQKYLDHLDELLAQVQPADLARHMPERFSVTGLVSRKRHARHLRRYVDSLP
ncbi:MAG TPA: hypothetical protein VF177_03155, partial [Anaerolineae bacterium]